MSITKKNITIKWIKYIQIICTRDTELLVSSAYLKRISNSSIIFIKNTLYELGGQDEYQDPVL